MRAKILRGIGEVMHNFIENHSVSRITFRSATSRLNARRMFLRFLEIDDVMLQYGTIVPRLSLGVFFATRKKTAIDQTSISRSSEPEMG